MVKEVTRHIKQEVERELWARSAGRCQFSGCNKILYKSPVTQEKVNIAEKAHIYSFSEQGPRGWGALKKNPECLNDVDNLMLMCHDCHKTIDQDKEGLKYSGELLRTWKKDHELRIATITGITSNKKSHVVFYQENIGAQKSPLSKKEAITAMFPERYPAPEDPIDLSMSCSHQDNTPDFWSTEKLHLERVYSQKIEPLLENNENVHFSVFAFATMPMLIKLGTLFTDKTPVDTYQLMREPKGWHWQEFPEGFEFNVNKPEVTNDIPVLVISLSDKIEIERVEAVLGKNISVWELTVPPEHIGNDNIRSKTQLSMIRNEIRKLMRLIKQKYTNEDALHIFPAMSISCSVEIGRARMPKADMPWVIYDQNNDRSGFIKTIIIGEIQ